MFFTFQTSNYLIFTVVKSGGTGITLSRKSCGKSLMSVCCVYAFAGLFQTLLFFTDFKVILGGKGDLWKQYKFTYSVPYYYEIFCCKCREYRISLLSLIGSQLSSYHQSILGQQDKRCFFQLIFPGERRLESFNFILKLSGLL